MGYVVRDGVCWSLAWGYRQLLRSCLIAFVDVIIDGMLELQNLNDTTICLTVYLGEFEKTIRALTMNYWRYRSFFCIYWGLISHWGNTQRKSRTNNFHCSIHGGNLKQKWNLTREIFIGDSSIQYECGALLYHVGVWWRARYRRSDSTEIELAWNLNRNDPCGYIDRSKDINIIRNLMQMFTNLYRN